MEITVCTEGLPCLSNSFYFQVKNTHRSPLGLARIPVNQFPYSLWFSFIVITAYIPSTLSHVILSPAIQYLTHFGHNHCMVTPTCQQIHSINSYTYFGFRLLSVLPISHPHRPIWSCPQLSNCQLLVTTTVWLLPHARATMNLFPYTYTYFGFRLLS